MSQITVDHVLVDNLDRMRAAMRQPLTRKDLITLLLEYAMGKAGVVRLPEGKRDQLDLWIEEFNLHLQSSL